jgi:hypothetical protein
VGQAKAQGAGSHARHGFDSKPVDRPPEEMMRMPAVSQDNLLFTSRAQAKEQAWQPMHLSICGVVSIFAVFIRSPHF